MDVTKIINFVNENYFINVCISFDNNIEFTFYDDDLTFEKTIEIEYGKTTEEIIKIISEELDKTKNM